MKLFKHLFARIASKKEVVSESATMAPVTPPESVKPDYSEFADDPVIQKLDQAIADGLKMQSAVGLVSAEEMMNMIGQFTQQMTQASALMQINNADAYKEAGRISEEEHQQRVDNELDRYNRPPLF
jgi:hypothetical protein